MHGNVANVAYVTYVSNVAYVASVVEDEIMIIWQMMCPHFWAKGCEAEGAVGNWAARVAETTTASERKGS